ncbi:PEGA domain-containing protein [Archangium lansingense]|uniref:PEGA domain-containing protein n=1 Tax=Archangium lansingense TaxID=2995310 RepID=A0ABT4AMC4_9BACT|nr:PEGA domain-containing protein [Archangium lansinium]MCY1082843.1 PEGA domain-containing protein [Archangium lansinium]
MTFFKNSSSMVVVLALALGGAVEAAPRRVVVASGDCKNAELSGQTKALYDKLVARPGENVLSAPDFAERLFPQPSGSFEDIKRQLEAAQGQFYEARYAKAAQAIDEVLRQVGRLPPGEARWKLYVDTQLLQAMNQRSLGKVKESDDAFRNVLRLEPTYALDPDYYTPSTRQAFDKLRRELARAKKVKLSVKSNQSPSEVFLEGRSVGQTPLVLEVPAGTYDLTVKKGEALSFPRQLQVQGQETPVLVDLAYEGAISASPFPCLASDGENETELSHAVRLGGTLGVEEVIVVKLEGASSGPKWLAATVLNVEGGQKLREGGFKTQGLDAPAESLAALVDFVTTGKGQPSLVVATPDNQPPWEQPSVEQAALTPEMTAQSGTVRPLRVVSYVTLGAGVAALAGAGYMRLSLQPEWEELTNPKNGHLTGGKLQATDARGIQLLRSVAKKQNTMVSLLIGSGAAIATGTVLFFLSPNEAPPPVSVGVMAGPDGAGATLSGTF